MRDILSDIHCNCEFYLFSDCLIKHTLGFVFEHLLCRQSDVFLSVLRILLEYMSLELSGMEFYVGVEEGVIKHMTLSSIVSRPETLITYGGLVC